MADAPDLAAMIAAVRLEGECWDANGNYRPLQPSNPRSHGAALRAALALLEALADRKRFAVSGQRATE